MLQQIFGFIGARSWTVSAILLAVAIALWLGLLGLTVTHSISFRLSRCEVRDNTFELHDTTYRLSMTSQKEGGAIVRLCIRESVKTKKDNLVEVVK